MVSLFVTFMAEVLLHPASTACDQLECNATPADTLRHPLMGKYGTQSGLMKRNIPISR